MIRRTQKILTIVASSIVVVFLLAIIYTQTDSFKNSVRKIILNSANESINGKIVLGEIKGNLLTGFSVDSVWIDFEDKRIFSAQNISMKYDLFSFVFKNISISSLIIQKPILLAEQNEEWNLSRLIKKSDKPSDLDFSIKELQITDGVVMIDIFKENRKIVLTNLKTTAQLKSSENSNYLKIINSSFNTLDNDFTLTNLETELDVKNNNYDLKYLKIGTPNSNIDLSASIENANLLNGENIDSAKNIPIKINLGKSRLSKNDIMFFLKDLKYLPESINLSGEANGTIADLAVNNFAIAIDNSTINFNGKIKNLNSKNNLSYLIASKISSVSLEEIKNILIPDAIKNIKANADFAFEFSGDLQKTNYNSKINGDFGEIKFSGDFTNSFDDISSNIELINLQLEKIFSDYNSSTSLNAKLNISGNLNEEIFNTIINLENSKYNKIEIYPSKIEVEFKNNIYASNMDFKSSAGTIFGNVEYGNAKEIIPLNINLNFNHLDLSKIFQDEVSQTNLNGNISANINNLSVDTDDAKINLLINNSKINYSQIDTLQIKITSSKNENGEREIKISSPIVDATLTGKYNIKDLQNSFTIIHNDYKNSLDKLFINSIVKPSQNVFPDCNLNYALNIKNLDLIRQLFNVKGFNTIASLRGDFISREDTVSSTGLLQLHSGKYTIDSNNVLVDKSTIQYDLKNYTLNSLFKNNHPLSISIKATAENVFINENILSHLAFETDLNSGVARFLVFSEIDSLTRTEVQGKMFVENNYLTTKLSNFYLRYNKFEMHSKYPIIINANNNALKIDSAMFYQNDEELHIKNILIQKNILSGNLNASNLQIRNLAYLVSGEFARFLSATEGTITSSANLSGTILEPRLVINGTTSVMKLNNVALGRLNYSFDGTPKSLTLNALLQSDKNNVKQELLKFNGTIPLSKIKSNDSLNIEIALNNFPATLIDPFINEVENMTGSVYGNINYTGGKNNPIANGYLETSNGKLVLVQNGVEYNLSAKLNINNNLATINHCTIKNISEDYSNGRADLSGSIVMKDYFPFSYNVDIKGELQVLTNHSRHYTPSIYGTIIASTLNDAINLRGENNQVDLKGTIYITNASITLPPTHEEVLIHADQSFELIIVDDTSKSVIDSLKIADIVEFLQARMKEQEILELKNNNSNINYDITFQSRGSVAAKFIFNPTTNEELLAYLDGKLSLRTINKKLQLTGDISLSNNSTYTFYKNFSAQGSLFFSGNIKKPILKINAMYEADHLKADTTVANPIEKTRVKLSIEGDRDEPKIKIMLFTLDDNKNEVERFGDVESDAISFLLTSAEGMPGKFREDLTLNDKQSIAEELGISIGNSIVSNFTSTILSGMLMDFIRASNIPFVTNAEFRYASDASHIKLSGEVLDAYWSVGGKMFNDINSTNFNVQLPLSSIIGNKNLRNFIFELERKAEPLETTSEKQAVHGARIYYKIHF